MDDSAPMRKGWSSRQLPRGREQARLGDAGRSPVQRASCYGNELCGRCLKTCDDTIRRVGAVYGVPSGELEDFIQDAWLKVLSALARGDYDPRRGSLTNWLFVVARNRATTWFRRRRAAGEAVAVPLDLLPGPSGNDPAVILDRHGTVEQVRKALALLRQRTNAVTYRVFYSRRMRQMSVSEVARMLHLPPAQVRLLDHRAGRKLADLLRSHHSA